MSSLPKNSLKFRRQPAPVLPEHRPLYRIGLILLVLELSSRGGRSSVPRLHLFNWALKSSLRSGVLSDAVDKGVLRTPAWGFDPALAIALQFAQAEQLVRYKSGSYELTPSGAGFIKDVLTDPDLFSLEKAVLTKVGKRVTEAMVDTVAKEWSTQ